MAGDFQSWWDLREKVCKYAAGFRPPVQYWLESDGGPSYCRACAIAARGKEFELGPLIKDVEWFERDGWENAYFEEISCYADGCAGESDGASTCYTCGKTLDYWLTDYGIGIELDYWAECQMSNDLPEIAYSLDRLFECKDEDQPLVRALATRFLQQAQALSTKDTGQ